jgi:hypothetical protein
LRGGTFDVSTTTTISTISTTTTTITTITKEEEEEEEWCPPHNGGVLPTEHSSPCSWRR